MSNKAIKVNYEAFNSELAYREIILDKLLGMKGKVTFTAIRHGYLEGEQILEEYDRVYKIISSVEDLPNYGYKAANAHAVVNSPNLGNLTVEITFE